MVDFDAIFGVFGRFLYRKSGFDKEFGLFGEFWYKNGRFFFFPPKFHRLTKIDHNSLNFRPFSTILVPLKPLFFDLSNAPKKIHANTNLRIFFNNYSQFMNLSHFFSPFFLTIPLPLI
jgi:hypothetical protein